MLTFCRGFTNIIERVIIDIVIYINYKIISKSINEKLNQLVSTCLLFTDLDNTKQQNKNVTTRTLHVRVRSAVKISFHPSECFMLVEKKIRVAKIIHYCLAN